MPQLHHRDPSIIGLLGASPHFSTKYVTPTTMSSSGTALRRDRTVSNSFSDKLASEALDEIATPPASPTLIPQTTRPTANILIDDERGITKSFKRPFYGIIVDGIHIHPNSVRVRYPCSSVEIVVVKSR